MSMRGLRILGTAGLVWLAGNVSPAVELENICRYCGRDHAAEAAAAARGETARKYAPDRVVDVKHIKIDVTPDFDERTIAATTTITFSPISKPVEELTLDAVRLQVSDVAASLPLADYVVTDHHLTLLFAEPVPVGQEVEVSITYTAEPKQGLYFRTPELGYPEQDTHLWTQGETHEAPHWFPCFDYPNERSTTEVICTVPTGMVVVSNGRKVAEAPVGGEKLRVHWLQDKPHANYLVCLVAGKFVKLEDEHRDISLGFYTQPTLAEHAPNAFAETRDIMAFFEQEIGVPYPWDKYDQATIRDFSSGGMENTSITTLYHGTIWAKESENIRSSHELNAHEMAHQWFGDYVTCEDWAHLWLNEGFATYYTHLYNGHRSGRPEMLYGLWQDARGRVLPESDDTKPIVYRDYNDAWEQFDYRAYPKGGWVLHMLRNQLGEDLYRHGIQRYLEQHGQSSVVTADLMLALEEVSGRELERFFDQWVFGPGSPKLKVRYKWLPKEKLARVTVEQTHKLDDDHGLFELPTKLRFTIDGHTVDHPIEITQAKHEFYVPLTAQPELVRFDPDYTLLAEVDFDKSTEMLERQLKQQDDVIGQLLAIDALADDDSKRSIEALSQALASESFYGVRIAAAETLAKIGSDEAYEVLASSQQQSDARVRQAVVSAIGKFYRPATLTTLQQVLETEQNPEIVGTALRALSKFSSDDTGRTLEAALDRESFGNRIAAAAIDALGDTGDESLRGKLLNKLNSDRHDFSDRDYGKALVVVAELWSEADDRQPVRDLLQQSLKDPARQVRTGAIKALGALGDATAVPALESYADRQGEGRDVMAAKKAIETLQEDAPFVPSEVRELRKLVGELRKEQKSLRKELDTLKAKTEATEDGPTTNVSGSDDAS